jgi:hypothetical protein
VESDNVTLNFVRVSTTGEETDLFVGDSDSDVRDSKTDEATRTSTRRFSTDFKPILENYKQRKDKEDETVAHLLALPPIVIRQYMHYSYTSHQVLLQRNGAADNSHYPLDVY